MISIVFPVFNEEGTLKELHQRLNAALTAAGSETFEFIFVDDCSTDRSPKILDELRAKDGRVKIIRFARNCGSHAALTAGLTAARGDCAIVMAADLQDPPALIPRLLEKWKEGAKIVWGVRSKREGEALTTTFFSRMYYAMMNRLTSVRVPPSGADVFLADRSALEAFRRVKEKHTSVFMVMAWLGFRQASLGYVKEKRFAGTSQWTLGKKVRLTLDSLLAFSDVPVRAMSGLGILTALLGFAYAVLVFLNYLNGSPVQGWSSLMVVILVVGGTQMIMLGMLGEYLWRTFDESRKRPRYVVDLAVGIDKESL